MIKRILVALDLDNDTPIAIRYAISLAERFDASISGLAIVDTGHIDSTVGVGPIGTMYYAQQLHNHLTEEARTRAGELLETFEQLVSKSGVKHSELMEEGVPFERIQEDLKFHDLLIIGRETHFFYNRPSRDTNTISRLVKNSSGPVLVVTPDYLHIDHVIVTHDGSVAASRALQWLVQLQPFGNDITIDILNVCEGKNSQAEEQSRLIMHLTSDYLRHHGYERISQVSLPKGNTGEVILEYIQKSGANLITLGAHSMAAIRRITFGSTTHKLVMESPIPLLLSS
ncbi:universal stress protein [Balneola sp. MJW-20]|uniref:universal stress protein n=1 Tax=Gracilimonas aurantiaca TaxID=3234185 RepID=UPI0034677240